MRILITNQILSVRAGTESFVRDLARGLQSLGHTVMAYTSDLSRVQRLLERDLIPVTTDPGKLPVFPDIIHAHHHLDAMSALTALPGVPAIYHDHGGPWQCPPPVHPRIHHYLANSSSVAASWQALPRLSASEITFFPHPLDSSRFLKIRKPSARPARALLVDSRLSEQSPAFQEAQEAARRCGLALELGGPEFAPGGFDTEHILPEYDLVFACGSTALEALACGCLVVATAPDGRCELVRQDNYERLRQENFTPGENAPTVPLLQMAELVRLCNSAQAEILCEKVRRETDFSPAVASLVEIYGKVIERQRHTKSDLPAEGHALSDYLRMLQPSIMQANEIRDSNWPLRVCWQHDSIPTDTARHG